MATKKQITEVVDGNRTIKVGQTRNYTGSTGNTGKGEVVSITPTKKGPYVAIYDKVRGRNVSVRCSQVK